MVDVSVIIINYNTLQLTDNCIRSIIEKTTEVTYEIILVDNASTDGSIGFFQKDKRVKFIQSPVNLGFGKANNLGYEYSQGKYIFLLNSDTFLKNNALKLFYDEMEKRSKKIACMGCLLTDVNGNIIHSYARFPTILNELFRKPLSYFRRIHWIKEHSDGVPIRKLDDHCLIVEYVTGADLFIRRSVVDQLGLFDPEFFMYYEETEMQYRYGKSGLFSCIIDSPQIVHLEGGSHSKKHSAWIGKSLGGLMICFRKIHSERWCTFLKFVLIVATLPKAVVDVRYSFKEKIAYFRKIIES